MIAGLIRNQAGSMNELQKHLTDFFNRSGSPSQQVVAGNAGISRIALNRIFHGHQQPSLATAESIAIATGTTLAKILRKYQKKLRHVN